MGAVVIMWGWLLALGLTAVACLWIGRSWSSIYRSAAVLRSTGSAYEQCPNVFIDLGANAGPSLNAFVDWRKPVNYRKGKLRPFGKFVSEQNWNSKEFCIFAFEGNPHFTEKLRRMESDLTREGFAIEVFTETIVSAKDGLINFLIDEDDRRHVGSTISNRTDNVGWKAIGVKSVRLSRFIRERIDPRSMVFIKMDIEGAEYEILPDLLSEGLLCPGPTAEHRYIDVFNVEFHCKLFRGPLSEGLEEDLQRQCFADKMWPYLIEGCGVKYDNRTD